MGLVLNNSYFKVSDGVFRYVQVSGGGGVQPLTYTVTELLTTPGSGSWTKPSSVTEVTVEAWGGGGAGGGGISNPAAGGGGAGGQYARTIFTYASDPQTIPYVVGAGGTGGQGNGLSGSTSTWNSVDVVAVGGAGGIGNAILDINVPGGEGSTLGGVGDVVYRGGSGQIGSAVGTPINTAFGGSAGGGAGSLGNGQDWVDSTTGGTGSQELGGAGGNGVSTTLATTPGNAGSNYGGGGGGGATFQAANAVGGSGGQGLIRVSYTIPPPLDLYTGSSAAFSIRKLSESASFCMKVRRDSDDAFQDIGFQADGVIDTGSLLTFVGSATGYVQSWYNQVQLSGSYDADIVGGTTFSSQPYIVSSGSLITLNGKPAVFFNSRAGIGVNNFLPQTTDASGDWFTIGVGQVADTTTRLMVRTVNSQASLNIGQNIRRNTTNIESIAFNQAGGSFTDLGSSNPGTNQFLAYVQRLPTSVEVYVNNATNGSTATTGTPYSSSGQFYIGFFGGTTTPTFPWSGSIQEIIHYGKEATVFNYRNGLSSEINSFYGIY